MAGYVLEQRYRLRGWDRLPYALVDTRTGRTIFPPKDVMEVLLACDGTHDLDVLLLSPQTRELLAQLDSRGYIRVAEPGETISAEQRYRFFENRYVSAVHWAVTGRCNFRCRHCYMFAPHAKFGELSLDTLLEIARQIGESGVPAVQLTGGEPLIRRDFLEIVDALLAQGTAITQLYTNGALLDEMLLDAFAQRGIQPAIVISFDGAGWHDWMRGVPGAEQKAERAIALCAERGFPTRAQMTLHKGNAGSLRETVLRLAALGCSALRVNCVDETGEWLANNDGQTFSNEEFFETALSYLPAYYEDGMPLPLTISNLVSISPELPDEYRAMPYRPGGDPERRLLFSCARQALLINADGRPSICDSLDAGFLGALPLASDNPDEQTMPLTEQLMTGSPYMSRMDMTCSRVLEQDSACAQCPYVSACWGGCHAQAYRSCKNVAGADPVNCLFFKGGYAQRLIAAMDMIRPGATSPIHDDPLFRREGQSDTCISETMKGES